MAKRTHASVTETLCTCHYLERESDDPDSPIRYDARLHEFCFEYPSPHPDEQGKARLHIYHCPFCGGAAPPSKREALFLSPTREEQERVLGLFRGLQSLEEVIATLGPPDQDLGVEHGVVTQRPEGDGEAPALRAFRTLRYSGLSDTVDALVHADVCRPEVQVTLYGKPSSP